MARQARIRAVDRPAWYHIYGHAAEYNGVYPLERKGARQELLRLIRKYTVAYFCGVSAYSLMGNHSHMVARFEAPREVDREELHHRALLLYPGREKMLSRWMDEAWEQLRCRLFDVSELMRNIQGQFAEWLNLEFDRPGHFWAERFQSSILADGGLRLLLNLHETRDRSFGKEMGQQMEETTGDRELDLENLASGLGGLNPRVTGFYAEAAAICLSEEGHRNGQLLTVHGIIKDLVRLLWDALPDQAFNSWKDQEVATEFGAVAIALLLIEEFTEYTVRMQSRKRTGFDYLLGLKSGDGGDASPDGFARLEVSGIRNGRFGDIQRRLHQKLARAQRFDQSLSIFVIVVEFGGPRSLVEFV